MTQIYLRWRVQTPWLKVWMSNIVQPLIIPPPKKTASYSRMCKSFLLTYRWALTNKKRDPIRTNVTSSKHHVHVYVTVYTYVYTYSIQPIKPCKTYFSISNQNISSSSKMRGKFRSKPLYTNHWSNNSYINVLNPTTFSPRRRRLDLQWPSEGWCVTSLSTGSSG